MSNSSDVRNSFRRWKGEAFSGPPARSPGRSVGAKFAYRSPAQVSGQRKTTRPEERHHGQ